MQQAPVTLQHLVKCLRNRCACVCVTCVWLCVCIKKYASLKTVLQFVEVCRSAHTNAKAWRNKPSSLSNTSSNICANRHSCVCVYVCVCACECMCTHTHTSVVIFKVQYVRVRDIQSTVLQFVEVCCSAHMNAKAWRNKLPSLSNTSSNICSHRCVCVCVYVGVCVCECV